MSHGARNFHGGETFSIGSCSTKDTSPCNLCIMTLLSTLIEENPTLVKFIYSEKAARFCKIFTLLLSYGVPVKSKVKILQNCVAFSENMNFISHSNSFFELPPGLGCMTFFVVK